MLLEPVLLEAALATVLDRVALTFGASIECYILSVDQIMLMKALHVGNMVAQCLVSALIIMHNLIFLSENLPEWTHLVLTLRHVNKPVLHAVTFIACSVPTTKTGNSIIVS